ncbi:MAG: methyltransferase [Prevotellaceae bacterium]|nr:methyltransferase [Prevotellaceae bacterium]
MANDYFKFKQFIVRQDRTAMKVCTDSVLLGSWLDSGSNSDSKPNSEATSVLDVGTGTGLLALMSAQTFPEARITAVEIDPDAARQAADNFAASKWNERLTVLNLDFRHFDTPQRFDLAVSNPPYFANSLKSACTSKNFARHDDSLSLDELFARTAHLLADNGRFALILPCFRVAAAAERAAAHGLFPSEILNVKTKADKPPYRTLLQFSFKQTSPNESLLILLDDEGQYSDEYRQLTRRFL